MSQNQTTEDTDNNCEYDTMINELIVRLGEQPTLYPTADALVGEEPLIPYHPSNLRLLRRLANPDIKITPSQLERALKRKGEEQEREARFAAKIAQLSETNRALATESISTEREMVRALLRAGNWSVDYGGRFTASGGPGQREPEVRTMAKMLTDIQLTAGDLGLTRKPLLLKDQNFERALIEYYEEARAARKAHIWRSIEHLAPGQDAAAVIADFTRICGFYTREPAFDSAAFQKVIWSVKRKMQQIKIPYHHFVVLYSNEQGSGKTDFWGFLKAPVQDLCREAADLSDLVSSAQLELFSYYLIDIPEMSGTERADVKKLKALVTQQTVDRRLFYTQTIGRQEMCSTFTGSCNEPIPYVMKDSTGMRRMVQIDVKRIADIKPHWDEIKNFDFLALWQAVDHLGEDPLTPFWDVLTDKQEEMRTKDRVENWLDDFASGAPAKGFLPGGSQPPHHYQYEAKYLFGLYRAYEMWACAGGTPMQEANWRRKFKDLIETNRLVEWEMHNHGNARRLYLTYTPNQVIALNSPQCRS